MSFITTVPESAADGDLAHIYQSARETMGYVPNYTRAFSIRPDLYRAWATLIRTVSSAMDPRRYELATVGAALTLRSSYCSLAHGEKLLGLGSTEDEVRALAQHGGETGLTEQEAAIVAYAAKIAGSASSVTEADIDLLRSLGLTDVEIFDVAAAAAARCFFSKMLDATGVLPDAVYRDTIPDLVDILAVGRPIEES